MEAATCASSLVAVVLGAALLLAAASFHRRRGRRRRYRLPPGPKPLPIIGNLNLIGSLPHVSVHELSLRYGPLMYLRFGSCPVVAGSSVAMAKFFLKTHDLMFLDRPKLALGKYTMYNYSGMLWASYGPYWRQLRKMCQVELFTAARLQSYEHLRREELCETLRHLHRTSGRAVKLRDTLMTLSLGVISRMVLGKKYVDVDGGGGEAAKVTTQEEFRPMIEELFFLLGAINIGDFIPWLKWLDPQGYIRRMKRLGKTIDRFLEQALEEHIKRRDEMGDEFVEMDMMDIMLKQADDPSQEVQIKRDDIKGFTLDLLAAGTDTTAITVEWAVAELIKNPEVMAKAVEELDRVVGRGRLVTEKDAASLPYLDAVVKETLRTHPGGPFLSPRLSSEDTAVDGYDIPAGTRILVCAWAICRDPAVWERPLEFRPERFAGSRIDVKGNDFELLPFGAGRRMCPGYSLGLKMVHVALANLLHCFEWRLPGGMKKEELGMEVQFGISLPRKAQLEVVFEPKLPLHIYTSE